MGAFLDIMGEITPLAESAQIAYKKLAKGEITATARFTEDRDALKAKLNEDGRIRFPVEVEMTNADGHRRRRDDGQLVRAPQRRLTHRSSLSHTGNKRAVLLQQLRAPARRRAQDRDRARRAQPIPPAGAGAPVWRGMQPGIRSTWGLSTVER